MPERANITHFHKLSENQKYLLLIIISSDSNRFVDVDLCFRQGLNNYRVNDPRYRFKYNVRIPFKENPTLFRQLISNQVSTTDLVALIEEKHGDVISTMEEMLLDS